MIERVGGQAQAERQNAVGTNARVDAAQLEETPHGERGAHQKKKGKGRFRDHEQAANALSAGGAGGTAAALLEHAVQVGSRRLESGRESEQNGADERHDHGENENRRIDADRGQDDFGGAVRQGDGGGQKTAQKVDTPDGGEHASGAAEQADDEILGEELAQQAPAVSTERSANTHLETPPGHAREQQVGDVGAGQKENKKDACLEHPQGRADILDERVLKRNHDGLPILEARVLLRKARADRVHVLLGGGKRYARLEPRHHAEITVKPGAPTQFLGGPGHERVGGNGRPHVRRQHSDALIDLVIHRQAASDNVRVAAELPLPETISDHRNVVARGALAVFGPKQPAHFSLGTEQRKKIRCYTGAWKLDWFSGTGERSGAIFEEAHVLEGPVLIPPIEEIGSRGAFPLDVQPRIRFPNEHQALGMRIRQRTKENRVHHAEDGGVGADSESQDGDDQSGEAGAPSQRPVCVSDVLHQIGMSTPLASGNIEEIGEVRGRVFDPGISACVFERFRAGWAKAVSEIGFRVGFDVHLELLPIAGLIADFLAAGANRQETAENAHLGFSRLAGRLRGTFLQPDMNEEKDRPHAQHLIGDVERQP